MLNSINNCPCGSGQSYTDCCQPFHLNQAQAKTAEALMRSRFSAYYLGRQNKTLAQYLLKTWCDSTRPNDMDLSDQPNWTTLNIHRCEAGQHSDQKGLVEFSAFYAEGLFQTEFREISYFQRNAAGGWCYLKGHILRD
jgi:SEC-C motif-containing protein